MQNIDSLPKNMGIDIVHIKILWLAITLQQQIESVAPDKRVNY